jgi:hypothetical protein
MQTMTGEAVATRFHPRVGAQLVVKLKLNGRAVSARSTDLSMAGLCLQGEFPELADQVTLAIPLPDDKHVITQAKVKWREAGKVALEFAQLDWEDMFALARFLHPRLP